MNSIDLAKVRADTPAVDSVVHFNNAGSSLSPTPVLDTAVNYLRLEASLGGYEAYDHEAPAFARFYESAATLLGCSVGEVAFSTSASDAWWRAFSVVPLTAGDRVLTSRAEYSANMYGLLQAKRRGVEVVLIDNDGAGQIDLGHLEAELLKGASLVAATQISMASGTVNPVAEIGRLAKAHGALYLLDACQAAGQRALDVEEIGCDFLLFTGRKWLRGPRGSGLLYVRSSSMSSLLDPVFVDGRSATWPSLWEYEPAETAQRFEMGEVSFASMLGLGAAMDYALHLGLGPISSRIQALAAQLRAEVGALPGVNMSDRGADLCGICTFRFDSADANELKAALRARGYNVSVVTNQMSQIDLGERGIDEVLRASVHYYNTEDEVSRFTAALAGLLEG